MYKPTEKQPDLFGAASELSDAAQRRLEDSWAEPFRRKVWPVLLDAEDGFADLYDAQTGRGCWSIARKLGMCILQEWFDLTDNQIVDRLSFDLRFQYALMLRTEQAYLSRQGLSDFRRRLVEADPAMERLQALLVRVAKAMGEDLELEFSEQRTDATHIESNIEVKGRAALMAKTIRYVDTWVKDNQPACRADYSEGLKEWLETDNSTTFGRLNRQEYQAKLDELAEWAWELYRHLKGDEEAMATEEFTVLRQLIDEQVVADQTCHRRDAQDASADPPDEDDSATQGGPEDGDDKQVDSWEVESRETPCSDCTSLQSPYDPDAGYRHDKGPGYNVHITETCGNDEVKPEAITDIEVEPMDTDHGKLPGIVRRLHRSGYGPDTIYADGGYTSGLELLKIRFKGTEPVCPVPPGNRDPDRLGRHEFDVDAQTGRVLECPAGKTPFRHRLWRSKSRKKGKALHAFFYPSQCRECPMKDRCPTEAGSSDGAAYRLEMRASQIAHDQRVAEQETESFKEAYKIRSGVEATASELKRAHGIGKLRVRGLPKVRMKGTLKAIGCNIKRWVKAIIDDDGSWQPSLFFPFYTLFQLFTANRGPSTTITGRRGSPNH